MYYRSAFFLQIERKEKERTNKADRSSDYKGPKLDMRRLLGYYFFFHGEFHWIACLTHCYLTSYRSMDEYNVSGCFSSEDETDEIFESPCTQDPTTSSALIPTTEISLNSSVSDVEQFLQSNGIPEKFCHVFEGKV